MWLRRSSALLVASLATACIGASDDDGMDAGDGPGTSECGPTVATVTRVVDGDTVELDDGTRVRYLLIDTPESTQGATDCFGQESSDFNRALVEGREIQLSYDVDCDDMYDRLLAYVTVGGQDVNRLMVDRGLACVLHIPPNGEARVDEFLAAEQTARDGGVGMWGACQEVTCD